MAETTTPATADTSNPPSTVPAAILVVLTIAAVAATIIVVFAFSTQRTPASIDGTTATTSQFID